MTLSGETLLGRYYLRELIDSGGMSDVYLAWDQQRSVYLAVKVLRRDLSRNSSVIQLFQQEAEILRKLEHPNIVRMYEFERDDDVAFLVMDWVEGENLAQSIRHRQLPFTPVEVQQILEPVCGALNYAHRNQIFHCDVKPANIMLHNDGRVLLTDFGVARLAGAGVDGGTPPYMAPEQFDGRPVDARTDVYALGIVIYEMLAGRPPFRGDSTNSKGSTLRDRIEWEHRFLPVPPLWQVNPGLDPRLNQLVTRAMSKEISERYCSVSAMLEALNAVAPTKQAVHEDETRTILGGNHPGRSSISPRPEIQRTRASDSIKKPDGMGHPQDHRGVSGPVLFCRQGILAGQQISIPPQGLTIGRGSQCQLRINEPSVSRSHATIEHGRMGKLYIRDEGSSLGTFINGVKIIGVVSLETGDVIALGYHEIFEIINR